MKSKHIYKHMSKNIIKKPELVAPAGDWTMLNAAIKAGADAVYFGVDKLNMRANAENFSLRELPKVVEHCHKNNVRVHLTLNSVVFEDELKYLDKILKVAKKTGVDMVICWDMAVVQIAKKYGIPICLSTQASVANSMSANFYKKLGVKRIVLARECSLDDIKKIKKKTNVEVELFVHGAMCVSISGRCFLSHHIMGKSANRGECVQPCRREYTIIDEQRGNKLVLGKNYVLSPKDLCTIEFIDKFIDAGIDAFKIEGRMRSPEYVYVVTKAYREVIDLYAKEKNTNSKSASAESYNTEKKKELLEKMKKVFNKGFSTGFYFGKPSGEDWSEKDGNASREKKEYAGKVLHYDSEKKEAVIKLEAGELRIGDRIFIQGPKIGHVEEKISLLRIGNANVKIAKKGDVTSIKIGFSADKNDCVYRIIKC